VLQVLFDKLKSYSGLLVRAGIGRYCAAFEKMPDSYRESKTNDLNPYVLKAQKFIEENYKKDLSLKSVADNIGISPFPAAC
jgi:YesN/AraC family two-component response regulator